jgi:hypothetical protein
VRFCAAIGRDDRSEDAAAAVGVSAVGTRWFRDAGGVNPSLAPTVSGRDSWFVEREDIAVRHEGECGRHRPAGRVVAADDLA